MIYHTLTIGGDEYRLRLTSGAIKAIEKKLGQSLFNAIENIQDNMMDTITAILWGAIQPLNANFSYQKADGLFDQYINDGNTVEDLMQEINALFEVSGFCQKGQA